MATADNQEPEARGVSDAADPSPSETGSESTSPPALEWMRDCRQWGTRAPLGPHGLTLGAINVGLYGDIPEVWSEMTRMPRGAYPVEGVPRLEFYPLSAKVDLWADNAPALYEEAIQRRWTPQVDVAWETLTPFAEDVELAMCQLCTELSQQAVIEDEVLALWLYRMSYGYYEVKSFLASEMFDASRHFDVFRRRAALTGGTLGLESAMPINRRLLESRAGWTETALYLYILRGTLTLTLYRYGEAYMPRAVEKDLFRRCLQDKARHLAYGMAHLKYAIAQQGPGYALGLQRLLTGVEQDLATEMQDPVLWEALAVLFGGGIRQIAAGMEIVKRLQQDYLQGYLRRLQWVGIAKTVTDLHPNLQTYLPAAAA